MSKQKPKNRFPDSMIGDSWKQYESTVVPAEAGESQRAQTRAAFYAGAIVILEILRRISEDDVSEPEAFRVLSLLHAESAAFQDEMTS